MDIRPFSTYEQQPLAVTTSSASGAFTTADGKTANACKITNYGAAGAQVTFSATATPTAVVTGSAAGTKQCYIAAGSVQVVEKGAGAINFAAIADTGSTSLIFEAGEGS